MNPFQKQTDYSSLVVIGTGDHGMVRIYNSQRPTNFVIPRNGYRVLKELSPRLANEIIAHLKLPARRPFELLTIREASIPTQFVKRFLEILEICL